MKPTDHFTKLSLAPYSKAAIWGVQTYPEHFLNSKTETGRGDVLSSEELSKKDLPYRDCSICKEKVTAQAGDAAASHRDFSEPVANIQTSESQMEGKLSEESVHYLLLFRAIKLPRRKHLLNRHTGFKSTKMLYTFFSFHLIYLLWIFGI